MPTAGKNLSIKQMTKGKLPRLPFVEMKNSVLPPSYDLSLVFVGNSLSRKLNRIYRGKDEPTDILSFPLSRNSGEIFMDISEATRQAKNFGRDPRKIIAFLFIHGLFHLKGLKHGSTMEKAEKKIRKIFGV